MDSKPDAPSLPMPVSKTPTASARRSAATDSKVTVTEGLWPSTGGA
jgi:hypothetical protein